MNSESLHSPVKIRLGHVTIRLMCLLAFAFVPSVAFAQSGVPDLGTILGTPIGRPEENIFEMVHRPIAEREGRIFNRIHRAYKSLQEEWEREDRELKSPRAMTEDEYAYFSETGKIPESYLRDREEALGGESDADDNPDRLPTVLPEKKVNDDVDESEPETPGEVPDPHDPSNGEEEEGTEVEVGPAGLAPEFVAQLLSVSFAVPSVREPLARFERARESKEKSLKAFVDRLKLGG